MTHDSALDTIPCGAHRGRAPRLSMRRVVKSDPEGVCVREMTSQEMTCAAYGFG
jgi:hypothetical protein